MNDDDIAEIIGELMAEQRVQLMEAIEEYLVLRLNHYQDTAQQHFNSMILQEARETNFLLREGVRALGGKVRTND